MPPKKKPTGNATSNESGVLPAFEGKSPERQQFVFTGSHAVSVDRHEAHPLDTTVFAVVQLEVIGVNHKHDANGPLRRIETTSVKRYGFLPAGEGATLVEKYAPAPPDELDLGSTYDNDDDD